MATSLTDRDRAKADRQAAILEHAARLFAERGFAGVSLEDIGAAVGVSGPAVYRHFASKQALLGAILVGVSDGLLAGGRRVLEADAAPRAALESLVAFHLDFALSRPDVIRVQDRDLASLSETDNHAVRRLQREYVDLWLGVLSLLHPSRSPDDLRVRAHACFGLLNSTPHSSRTDGAGATATRTILSAMAMAALEA
ncbi:SACE_7040 family transcriptional regulator [Microbacterium terricola]|uniref:TetR family transcriptional regulator n=1 Tax=Microbacterium terricola TaxID=344163 RepID=A0ABM8DY45_9MICO|nr:TetR/AcrR family transcriptional regulator [Microbacterium terricola]UYK38803.1 TetR/AcrR family transcriptional regulator [Microbacterium terricola]BDV30502.1 TetR family transcriptional regulator [Microbacterium terricola]